jgi:hypothetical protein
VLYSSIFFAIAVGVLIAIVILVVRRQMSPPCLLIPLWVLVCIPTGILQEPNINRINLLLMGMVFAAGLGFAVLDDWIRGSLVAGLLSLLVFFGFFSNAYFTTQRVKIAEEFFDGLLPALMYAQSRTAPSEKICVTGKVNLPQIYALFSEPVHPNDYLRTVKYVDPAAPFREVAAYGRYTFDLKRCDLHKTPIVIAARDERVSAPFTKVKSYGFFEVYALH